MSRATFLRLVRDGKIPHTRSAAGQARVTLADLAAYLDALIATAA